MKTSVSVVLLLAAQSWTTDADNHGLLTQNLRGKYEHSLEHNYKEGTCGRPEWIAVNADGSDPPHGAVVGGRDLNIRTVSGWAARQAQVSWHLKHEFYVLMCENVSQEKTARGESLYVCRVLVDNGGKVGAASSEVVPGKTWMHRNDACCNAAIDGSVVKGDSGDSTKQCQVLTMRELAHSGSRLEWVKTAFVGDQRNQLKPDGALATGSDNESGPLYSCRFRDNNGDYTIGHTWFPRDDGFCCTAEYNSASKTAETHTSCEILVTKRC